MAGPTPEQVIAVNALLQQALQTLETQNTAAQQVAIPVSVQNSNLGLNLAQLTRALSIDGTATIAANLDQILIRTAAGQAVLQAQQQQDQELLNLLPARVTLQLRPGPDGLEATLVVGNRAAVLADKPVESLASNSALSSNQTLTAQIPKINQINQALVLPSSLFLSSTPEEFLAQLGAQVQGRAVPPETTGQNAAQNLVSTILQKLGFAQPANAQLPRLAVPAPALTAQGFAFPNDKNTGVGVSAPSSSSIPAFVPASTGSTPATAAALAASTPNAAAAAAQVAAPQTTAVKILAVATPQAGVSVAPGEEGAQIAVVRGNTPSGQPVLSVGDKFIAVQGAKNWPVGLQLKVLVGAAAGLVIEPGDENDFHAFPALRQALEALAAQSPQLYNDVARLRIPQASTTQLPGSLLFLFSALQKGAPAWLGEEVMEKMKEFGKEQLVRALSDQWRAQMGQEAEGPGGQWRGINIPLFDQQRLNNLRFYVYDPPDQRGRSAKRDPNIARRFLIDFNLTRLGPVQLDGLVHKKRLDLVVRTNRSFDADLRTELVTHFHRTLEEVRYAGELRFATNKIGWVEIKQKTENPFSRNI